MSTINEGPERVKGISPQASWDRLSASGRLRLAAAQICEVAEALSVLVGQVEAVARLIDSSFAYEVVERKEPDQDAR